MTWRRFKTLLSGITSMPNSALVNRLSAKGDTGNPHAGQKVITIDMDNDPRTADSFFASMVGPSKRTRGRRRGRK